MRNDTLDTISTSIRLISKTMLRIADAFDGEKQNTEQISTTVVPELPADKKAAAEPTQPAVTKTISFEEVRAALANKARAGFTAEVKALIEKHGASKLSDIDPSEYEAVLAEAEVFGNA